MYIRPLYPQSCIWLVRPFAGQPGVQGIRGKNMRQRKRKCTRPAANELIQGICRQEIEADVFELWLGISRLMARVTAPDRKLEAGAGGKRRPDRLG